MNGYRPILFPSQNYTSISSILKSTSRNIMVTDKQTVTAQLAFHEIILLKNLFRLSCSTNFLMTKQLYHNPVNQNIRKIILIKANG